MPRDSIREACNAFGRENILRRLVRLLDLGEAIPPGAAKAWLSEACSDPDVVARCLCEEGFARTKTLETLARAVAPDFVPNDFGDDPWFLAIRRFTGDVPQYLASFLLTRAFGRRSQNSGSVFQELGRGRE